MNQNFSYNYEQIPTPENINPYSGNIGKMMVSPNNKPSVDEFMYKFNKDNREQFNDYWFQRNDEDLIEGMKQVILSCQRDKYFVLKVLNFETIKDYNEINRTLYEYYSSKTKNGKRISITFCGLDKYFFFSGPHEHFCIVANFTRIHHKSKQVGS